METPAQKSHNHKRHWMVLIMGSKAQLALDPAGRLKFSWGSCDPGRGRDLARGGGVGTVGLGRAKGWRMGLGVNVKTINPTSAWPQVPIKFIYIFTLRPPLKRLCLDISKQRDVPIYLATKRSQKTGSWDQFIPPWPDWLSAHILPCSKITQRIFY